MALVPFKIYFHHWIFCLINVQLYNCTIKKSEVQFESQLSKYKFRFIPSTFRRTRKDCDSYWNPGNAFPHTRAMFLKADDSSVSDLRWDKGPSPLRGWFGYNLEGLLRLKGGVEKGRDASGFTTVNMVTIENIVTQNLYYTCIILVLYYYTR